MAAVSDYTEEDFERDCDDSREAMHKGLDGYAKVEWWESDAASLDRIIADRNRWKVRSERYHAELMEEAKLSSEAIAERDALKAGYDERCSENGALKAELTGAEEVLAGYIAASQFHQEQVDALKAEVADLRDIADSYSSLLSEAEAALANERMVVDWLGFTRLNPATIRQAREAVKGRAEVERLTDKLDWYEREYAIEEILRDRPRLAADEAVCEAAKEWGEWRVKWTESRSAHERYLLDAIAAREATR